MELELFYYIECFCNRTIIHSYWSFKSPVEFDEEYFGEKMVV